MTRAPLSTADVLVLQAILASPKQTIHGLTKLQKLLFIAAHPKDFGLSVKRGIPALRFKVYSHGPFSEEVYGSLQRLENAHFVRHSVKPLSALPIEIDGGDEFSEPRTLHVYEALHGAKEELSGADPVDLRLVREACKLWGWLTPAQLEDFVNRRVGLTPDLKQRFFNVPWDDFVRYAKHERHRLLPEPNEGFWKSEQAFRKELPGLLAAGPLGGFVAYIDGKKVGMGADDASLFDETVREKGTPPDFIGFLNASGKQRAVSPAF